jgi:hypothetical protein
VNSIPSVADRPDQEGETGLVEQPLTRVMTSRSAINSVVREISDFKDTPPYYPPIMAVTRCAGLALESQPAFPLGDRIIATWVEGMTAADTPQCQPAPSQNTMLVDRLICIL